MQGRFLVEKEYSYTKSVSIAGYGGICYGVFWSAWGHYGLLWGVVYGLFWPTWVGFRLTEYLLGSQL